MGSLRIQAYCPGLPGLGEYISGLNGRYPENFLRLFAACSEYGYEMLGKMEKRGVLALLGEPEDLDRTIGKSQRVSNASELIKKYRDRVLLDPERTLGLLRDLGEDGADGAIFFDPYGNLIRVGAFLNRTDIDKVNGQLEKAMKIKGKNGDSTATKHLSALYATKWFPVSALATSEGKRHTTMAMEGGKILDDIVFDPVSGLYGLEFLRTISME